jgi:hypothetical protein
MSLNHQRELFNFQVLCSVPRTIPSRQGGIANIHSIWNAESSKVDRLLCLFDRGERCILDGEPSGEFNGGGGVELKTSV